MYQLARELFDAGAVMSSHNAIEREHKLFQYATEKSVETAEIPLEEVGHSGFFVNQCCAGMAKIERSWYQCNRRRSATMCYH